VDLMSLAKDEARKIIENLPEQATWDDIMYQFYIKRKIEISLKAYEEGKVIPHEEVVRKVLSK
jgi:predicted transcriptional regulator